AGGCSSRTWAGSRASSHHGIVRPLRSDSMRWAHAGSPRPRAPSNGRTLAGAELAEVESRQCPARGDPGLREDISEMELDGACRDPALSGDILVGHSLAD